MAPVGKKCRFDKETPKLVKEALAGRGNSRQSLLVMNHLMTKTLLGAVSACVLGQTALFAAEPSATEKFERDRAAIKGMAGSFVVDFSFEETFTLQKNYELGEKYHETAKELVKVVKDDGKEIILQHLLVVGSDEEPKVIKHWGQVWRYEDQRILEFQAPGHWEARSFSAEEARGKWSQLVTQIDDSPRYEALGIWHHEGGVSEWISEQTRRPLPRREHSQRSDYDVLVGENRHIVSAEGWAHGQWNRKRVERDGVVQDLCVEEGLNTYLAMDAADLVSAEKWWIENHHFWDAVRQAWQVLLDEYEHVQLADEAKGLNLRKTLRKLEEEGEKVSEESALAALRPFFEGQSDEKTEKVTQTR